MLRPNSAAADKLSDSDQHHGRDRSSDAVGSVNVRRAFNIAGHEGRQLTGRHHEIHHGGDGANNGQKISDHFHWSFSPYPQSLIRKKPALGQRSEGGNRLSEKTMLNQESGRHAPEG